VTFEQFAVARLPSLVRYAIVLTGDRYLAQDIVQEGWPGRRSGGGASARRIHPRRTCAGWC
jgi:hypothetical protein